MSPPRRSPRCFAKAASGRRHAGSGRPGDSSWLQAYGLISREPRSDERDRLSDLERAPRQEAPAPPSDDPATTAGVEPIHDQSRPNGERIRTVVARPRGLVTPVPPGACARDGPAVAA